MPGATQPSGPPGGQMSLHSLTGHLVFRNDTTQPGKPPNGQKCHYTAWQATKWSEVPLRSLAGHLVVSIIPSDTCIVLSEETCCYKL